MPAPLETFQIIFNDQLRVIQKDDDSVMYIAGPFRTLDGVIINKVRVFAYLKSETSIRKFGFDLDRKQCINSILLKRKFGFLIPNILPFHPVPNASIAFYTPDEWGKYTLYEMMNYPGCAQSIGIRTFFNQKLQQEWIKYARKQVASLQEKDRQSGLQNK